MLCIECIYVNPNPPFHPMLHFPSWYLYVCSLYLCLYFCFANKFIYTIFLDSTLKGSVQFSHSVMSDSLQPYGLQHARLPIITISWSLLKLMSIFSMMPSNHLILCRTLLMPSIFPSIRVFSSESALRIRWPKYSSFSFSISLSNEYS